MLDPTKIPLGRLAVAYGLSDNEMDSMISVIGATFDYAWVKAEYNFTYPGLELFSQYDKKSLVVIIDGIFQTDEYYDARAEGFTCVAFRSGSNFNYTELLRELSNMRQRAEENLSDPEGVAQKYGIEPPTLEGTERMLKGLYRDKLMLAIRDMCLVDKAYAVRFLFDHDLHLQQEVKGLSRQFVEAVCVEYQQQVSPPNANVVSALDTQNSADQHIKNWTKILPAISGAEMVAAKLAIEKWKGKSHPDAYKAACPNGSASNPEEYVSRKKGLAERLAKKYGLSMPKWNTQTE